MNLGILMTGTWVFLGIITAWRVLAVVRTPTPTPGRIAVAALFGTAFLSNTFNRQFAETFLNQVRPGLAAVLSYVALMFFFSGFIYFFASSVENKRSWLTSFKVQATIPCVFSLLLIATWLATPREIGLPLFGELNAQTTTWSFVAHLIVRVYMFYGTVLATWLAWKAGQGRPTNWKWTFRTCSVGMGMCALGGPGLRTPVMIALWVRHGDFGPIYDMTRVGLNFLGIITLLTGLSLVAARTSLIRFAELVGIKRRLLALRPLWRLLHAVYPVIALHQPTSFARELLLMGPALRYRYRRRLIECRDGLWRLSPHVVDDGGEEPLDIEQQARLVLDAADRARRGVEPQEQAVAIAAPSERNAHADADADALVSLSRAIRRAQRGRVSDDGAGRDATAAPTAAV